MLIKTPHAMKKILHLHSLRAFFLTISLFTLLVPALSWGEEDEDAAELFDAWQEQVATVSRVAKPLSQIAENVTVITAADIKAMNAHTLADILDTVPGVQIEHNGGPGVAPYILLHSKDMRHIQVLLDGVAISSLDSLFPDTTSIPAMIIERVEIVKGAASTAWGKALGGVINVITKSPDKRPLGGSATASIGKSTTADTRAEISGSDGRLGYYLSGGYLGSNGLLPGRQVYSNQAYTKLVYDLPGKGQFWGTFNYHGVDSGTRYVPGNIDLREVHDNHTEAASLGFRYQLNDRLELELTGRHFALDARSTYTNISNGLAWQPVETAIGKDRTSGASVKLVWRGDTNLLVAGSDYNHLESSSNTSDGGWTYSPYTRSADRGSLYLNDTLTIGPVSLNPGVRLDHTQTHGDNFSATMGATWQLTDSTLLRAYTGLGNGLPELDANITPLSRIWNAQIGTESSAIPYLWVKGSLFRNEIWNIVDGLNLDSTIPERRIALGTELEIRTKPIYNTFLSSGYTFTDTTRTSDGSQVQPDTARHTLQVAVRYDDKTFRGWLNGRHISWNSPADYNAKDHGLIWDLHLGATLLKKENSSLEVFFSGHNLFDTAYYYRDIFPTTGRWFEGGMRVNF
jgi:vitamin B12 transporter